MLPVPLTMNQRLRGFYVCSWFYHGRSDCRFGTRFAWRHNRGLGFFMIDPAPRLRVGWLLPDARLVRLAIHTWVRVTRVRRVRRVRQVI